ncbi:uncharacterized protein PHACADRAFT_253822 [Phanerochaete carnosa HHB-10118-sp]|uniref:Uncharacterized protein n=1 Tax=Phanerochaete carnosa (strain HHB-10118-sp) TaxID=650164 RepID=K5VYE8_PHACS|nr:uncharacterized protein PHACADRAFT_253822 [Phanerochaete carnosa HHB-10118-sp]EKM56613.1 hypothetical protein PHACADRAFT_253822 [Phanerochaete carnosa HHB-10118-sp]
MAEQGGPTERLTTVGSRAALAPQLQSSQPQPLAPAPDSRTIVDNDPFDDPPTAAETMTGATSQDLYSGIGKPMMGQSSAEIHHDGHQHRKRAMQGHDQYGTSANLMNRDGVDLSGWREE